MQEYIFHHLSAIFSKSSELLGLALASGPKRRLEFHYDTVENGIDNGRAVYPSAVQKSDAILNHNLPLLRRSSCQDPVEHPAFELRSGLEFVQPTTLEEPSNGS